MEPLALAAFERQQVRQVNRLATRDVFLRLPGERGGKNSHSPFWPVHQEPRGHARIPKWTLILTMGQRRCLGAYWSAVRSGHGERGWVWLRPPDRWNKRGASNVTAVGVGRDLSSLSELTGNLWRAFSELRRCLLTAGCFSGAAPAGGGKALRPGLGHVTLVRADGDPQPGTLFLDHVSVPECCLVPEWNPSVYKVSRLPMFLL